LLNHCQDLRDGAIAHEIAQQAVLVPFEPVSPPLLLRGGHRAGAPACGAVRTRPFPPAYSARALSRGSANMPRISNQNESRGPASGTPISLPISIDSCPCTGLFSFAHTMGRTGSKSIADYTALRQKWREYHVSGYSLFHFLGVDIQKLLSRKRRAIIPLVCR
jgi:hypothetical protein